MRSRMAKLEEHQFQAETKKLLDIMIHSIIREGKGGRKSL